MSNALRVLQVEDSESDAALIARMLRREGYCVETARVEVASEMKQALERESWDVVIADYHLPQFSAPAALGVLQQMGLDIPFIVVSGDMGEDLAVEMMRAGAQDYMLKSNLVRLAPAVSREIAAAAKRSEDRESRLVLEAELRQSQKLEGIGRLAGGIAHDFNNLLMVISGYTDMLQEGLETGTPSREAVADAVGEISRAAGRAAGLTRQLLTFSRRRAHRNELFSIDELLRNFEKMLRRLIGEDIALTLTLGAGTKERPVLIEADPAQLEQVVLNLAVNAKDAMPHGGRLEVQTSLAGSQVMLAVTDSGLGMSQEVKARVFEPFFTTKEPGKGTGLGLSTAYGIVQQSGGTIRIESEPGRGTSFRMLFPVVQGKIAVSSESLRPAAILGSETILLVEDEASVRRYVTRALGHCGYTVIEAQNGQEALQRTKEFPGPIHLLITDVVMPEMGGLELAEHFRALRPGAPVLCMSGYSERMLAEPVQPMHYIEKPFQAVALLSRVRALLNAPPETRA